MSAPGDSNLRDRKRKSVRVRPLPPKVMARNLAIEKRRREAFNEKCIILARLIPGLDTTQRPNKVLIVDASIRELERQQNLNITAMQNIQYLIAENERLNVEVHNLRSQTSNFCACAQNTAIPTDISLQSIDFPTGFENECFREMCYASGSAPGTEAGHMRMSVQGDHCPATSEQFLQSFAQGFRPPGGFDMQHYQVPSTFDNSGLDPYLRM